LAKKVKEIQPTECRFDKQAYIDTQIQYTPLQTALSMVGIVERSDVEIFGCVHKRK
jgi:hypothetical protein